MKLFATVSVWAALACAVMASPVEAGQAPPAPIVQLKSRPDQPGDSYRFVREVREELTGPGSRPKITTSKTVFKIEVLILEARRRILRYTVLETSGKGSLGVDDVITRAGTGVPLEFEASAGYRPERILNWQVARPRFLEAVDTGKGDRSMKGYARSVFERSADGDDLLLDQTLLGMEPLARLQQASGMPMGRHVFAPRVMTIGRIGSGEDMKMVTTQAVGLESTDPAQCEAILVWETETRMDGAPMNDFRERTKLSTYDGWVVAIEAVDTHATGDVTVRKVTTITREGPAPGCGPQP